MLDHVLKRSLGLACLGLGSVLFALSCSDAKPLRAPDSPDAGGPACDLGTSGCACAPVTGCRLGLLCIANRCLPTEGGQGGVPNDSDVPDLPGYGGNGPTFEDDAGTTPTPSADASTDAAAPEADTGAPPGPDPDAGDGG
jgi:hypothetical protein